MSQSPINLTINGQAVQARAGQTVMEAATAVGIDIPGLCHHPELKPEGACRLCLVEIEKQRALQPACTFPVTEGLVIQTETEKVIKARKFALNMLFSERAHYCMYCPASGDVESSDCELQRLGYRYGLTNWEFTPNYAKKWAIDSSREYFVMDHGRCILCRRCVRACNAIAANHTLGLGQRGARTFISADDNLTFADSSCISCGTCLQVCPTGALMDRHSVFCGHEKDVQRTPGVCMGCAVGCEIEAVTRDNHLLRVESRWNSDSGGLLCADGRFKVLDPAPDRVLQPLVRKGGELAAASWEEALARVVEGLGHARVLAGLASPRLTTESLAAFALFFQEVLKCDEVSMLHGDVPPTDLGRRAMLADVAAADCIVVIGGDPLKEQKVAGYLIKRACDKGAKLFVINDAPTELDPYATMRLQLEDISYPGQSPFERYLKTFHLPIRGFMKLRSAVQAAARPVVLYGNGLSTTVYTALRALPEKAAFLPLINGTNAAGAARLGLQVKPVDGDALYVLLGDDVPEDVTLPHGPFTIVQAAYHSEWTEHADVVFPAPIWAEQAGHLVNLEGKNVALQPVLTAPAGVPGCAEVLQRIAAAMNQPLSLEQIPDLCMAV
jgi:formate dehydrogenase major subunit